MNTQLPTDITLSTPKIFVGRDKELKRLVQLVQSYHSFAPIIITGVGGVGKSTLVREFITNHLSLIKPRWRDVGYEVKWIDVERDLELDETITQFLNQLRVYSDRSFYLVVLDGTERLNQEQLLSIIGRLYNYKLVQNVLITTRVSTKIRNAEYLNLSSFSLSDAVALLAAHISQDISKGDLVRLAETLNGHPAAIYLTIEYLKDHPINEVWSFIKGKIYSLDVQPKLTREQIIKVVRPQIINATESLVKQLRQNPTDIYRISPRQFEEIVAELLDDMGWEVELTKKTRDGGKDILAYMDTGISKLLCLVEAKRHSKNRPVGVEIVRNLYGTFCDYQANSAMLVTTSRFSDEAKILQGRHQYQLSLKEYTDVVSWIKKYKAR